MKGKIYLLNILMAVVFLIVPIVTLAGSPGLKSGNDEEIRKNLPKLLVSNNAGTEFYLTFHPCWETTAKQNFIRIYISCYVETNVTLEIESLGIIKQLKTIPNDVVEFVLYPSEAQMYSKPGNKAIKPLPAQVWQGRAVKITSEFPIICYGVTRFQYTSDGYLALPVSSLGTKYTVSSYADPTTNESQYLPSFTSIVGIYDGTKVDFTVGGNLSMAIPLEDGVSEAKSGEKVSRILSQGDVWLIPGKYAFNDLSGSRVRASKPVNVISGNFCAYIPSETPACDYITEQELPESSWGTKYHVTSIIGRLKNSIIKIFPKEDQTDLFKDNQMFGSINIADGLRGSGWIERRSDDGDPRPVVYSANKPIYIVQYNTGMLDDNIQSDPFQMVLTPIEQYQKEIIWNTPGIKNGFGFKDNYVNIAYKASISGGLPEDLELADVKGGDFFWKPLVDIDGSAGDSFKDTALDGRIYHSKTYKLPSDGVYRLRAKDGMAVYAYGFDDADSYGYPTSVSSSDIEKNDTLPPVFIFNELCNGDVNSYYDLSYNKDPYWGGVVHDEPEIDPENMSKLALLYMDAQDSYNYNIDVQQFQVDIDYKTLFRLNISDHDSDARAHLVAIDRRGNRSDTIIEYYSQKFSITPKVWNFGILKPGGNPVTQEFLFTNTSEKWQLSPDQIILQTTLNKLKSQGFILDVDPSLLTKLLNPGQSLHFTVTFTPSANGFFSDSIGGGCTCCFEFRSIVKATVGESKIYANDFTFDEQVVSKKSQPADLVILNRISDGSNTVLTIKKAEYDKNLIGETSSGKPFEIKLSNGMSLDDISDENPIYVNLDSAFHFSVTFTPSTPSDFGAQISWIADADNPDNVTVLNGRSIQPVLMSNEENWGMRRSDMSYYKNPPPTNFTFLPYSSPKGAIRLINGGINPVKLGKPEILEDIGGSDFGIYLNGIWTPLNDESVLTSIFDGIHIESGKDTTFPIFFHPKNNAGLHRLRLAFNSDSPDRPESNIEGIAIWGRVGGEGFDFGEQVIGDQAIDGIIKIWNNKWEFGDSVLIQGFKVINTHNAVISTKQSDNPTFWYDLSQIKDKKNNIYSLPLILHRDDTLLIPCKFNPVTDGDDFSAIIETISDAENEAQITFHGTAISEGSFMVGDSASICKNESVILKAIITNTGSVPIHITGSYIKTINGSGEIAEDFNVLDNDFIAGSKYSSDNTHEIRVQFTPTVKYKDAEVQLLVAFEPNSLRTIFGDTCMLKVNAAQENYLTRGGVSTLDNPEFEKNAVVNVNTARSVTYGVFIEHLQNQSDFSGNYMNVSVNFRKDFLGLSYTDGTPEIIIGNDLASRGYSIIGDPEITNSGNNERISVKITGPVPLTDQTSEMEALRVTFDAYMPWYTEEEGASNDYKDAKPTLISHTVSSDMACSGFSGDSASVSFDPICFDLGRQPIMTGMLFGLKTISPNPIDSRGANIEFSVGWDNSFTEIKIYDANMKQVAVPISETMKEGSYSLRLPIEEMPSGVYFIKMTSSYYTSPIMKCVVEK